MADYPFLLPREMLSRIVSRADLSKFIASNNEFPELFQRISEACAQVHLAQNSLIALGLHGDGAPFTKTDSMEIISWNFLSLPTADRIPITSVSKKIVDARANARGRRYFASSNGASSCFSPDGFRHFCQMDRHGKIHFAQIRLGSLCCNYHFVLYYFKCEEIGPS